ncbi:MAG: serine hydrolase [Patescibacteria group bacterium]
MRLLLSCLVTVIVILGLCVHAPVVVAVTKMPDAGAYIPLQDEFASAVVMVPRSREVLYSFKPDKLWPAASLTKLPNALVWARKGLPYGKVVTMKKEDEVGGGRLRLPVGSKLTLRDLWYSSITASANNAAMALARASGLTKKQFLARMNEEARRAGAVRSTFVDPTGMNPKNMTTARDMAFISDTAFRNTDIRLATVAGSYAFRVNTPQRMTKTITNTNALLTQDNDVWVTGGKTGYLEESRYNFVVRLRPMTGTQVADPRQELLVVVLGAPTKEGSFASAKRLAEWAWDSHRF